MATIPGYEQQATITLAPGAAAFVRGGAGGERTLAANLAAFDDLALHPRILQDVSRRSTAVTVLGDLIATPVMAAPSAMHRMAHPDGEIATARGCGDAGALMVLSLASSYPVEAVLEAATTPVWFQLYVGKDRDRTADVARRAEAAGCRALVVTVDAPLVGGREREQDAGFSIDPDWFAGGHEPLYGLAAAEASRRSATEIWDPSLQWADVDWLMGLTALPVILKGVLRPDDAARAAGSGIAAVIVSNHGGRQLDTTPAAIAVLPEVVEAVDGRAEVYLDGGVRRGTDVVKALALGARAVLVGRPIVWGLAVDGAAGVANVLCGLTEEFELAMGLCGAPDPGRLSPDLVQRVGQA